MNIKKFLRCFFSIAAVIAMIISTLSVNVLAVTETDNLSDLNWTMPTVNDSAERKGTAYDISGIIGGTHKQTTYAEAGYRTSLIVDNGIETDFIRVDANVAYPSSDPDVTLTINPHFVNDNLGNRFVQVDYIIKNNSSTQKSISLASGGDVMIGRSDNAGIDLMPVGSSVVGVVMTELAIVDPVNTGEFVFLCGGVQGSINLVDVDNLWIGEWAGGNYYNNRWTNDRNSYAPGALMDSAMAWSWVNRTVSQNSTLTLSVLFGINPAGTFGPGVPNDEIIVPGMSYTLTYDNAAKQYVETVAPLYEKDSAGNFLYSINLSAEPETIEIPANYNMTKYSVDSGKTWVWSSKEQLLKKLPKLLEKKMSLWLSDESINLKNPGYHDVKQIRFNEIKERPILDKVIVNYSIYSDLTGITTGKWTLTKKGETSTINMDGLEVGVEGEEKGDPNVYGEIIIAPNGEPVTPLPSISGTNRVEKLKYLIRVSPKHNGDGTVGSPPPTNDKDGTYTAAGKSQKITVLSEQKVPKYKVKYKTETIKLKKGAIIFAGTNLGVSPKNLGNQTTAVLNSGEALYANEKSVTVSLSNYLSANPETIIIWSAATEKKPASAKQIYQLAPRAVISGATLTGINGKISLGKTYEVLKNNNKWSSSLPKITSSSNFSIRLKSTVKTSGGVQTGFAASKPGTISINYGVYDTTKNKSGMINATITPAP